MKFLKAHWKEIAIIILAIMFMTKCTSSGNYQRKYKKQVEYTEYAIDSLNAMYANSAKYIDSLKHTIVIDEKTIESLQNEVDIYKSQNEKLNDANNKLANKQVIVNLDKEKK